LLELNRIMNGKTTEVEVRAIISPAEFLRLKKFFSRKAIFLNHHKDETLYFDRDGKIRMRLEKKFACFIHKSGRIHDKQREELEIKFSKSDFLRAQKFMEFLGKPVFVRWDRERFVWKFRGFKAYLDNTKGYARIFELEAITDSKGGGKAYQKMLEIFKDLNIKPALKEKIKKHYEYYLKNWRKLV
jgi:predicted adenylyl cyclase CyaB